MKFNHQISQKRFLNDRMKIVLTSENSKEDIILDLINVKAYTELNSKGNIVKSISIRKPGGSFLLDISFQTQNQNIRNFYETFLFSDEEETNFIFRAVSEISDIKPYTRFVSWIINESDIT